MGLLRDLCWQAGFQFGMVQCVGEKGRLNIKRRKSEKGDGGIKK
jgi:hypothetical protein